MWIALAVSLILALLLLGVLLVSSPGAPKPFLDDSGQPLASSTSEKVRVDINGVEQGMFIQGRDTGNPVLLSLHGGLPDHFLNDRDPTGLEKFFTIAWWEQRGSGLSYHPDMPPKSLKPEQRVPDTLALTDHCVLPTGQVMLRATGGARGGLLHLQASGGHAVLRGT